MTIYQILSLFGFPALFVGSVGIFHNKMQENRRKTEALSAGMVALLRDRMLQSYLYHSDRGSVTMADRESWEDMYQQYHNLGGNGMMTDLRVKFMQIPISNAPLN